MRIIYSKNNPAKSSPRSDLNDGILCFFEKRRPNKKNNNQITSDMRSVPDLNCIIYAVN